MFTTHTPEEVQQAYRPHRTALLTTQLPVGQGNLMVAGKSRMLGVQRPNGPRAAPPGYAIMLQKLAEHVCCRGKSMPSTEQRVPRLGPAGGGA